MDGEDFRKIPRVGFASNCRRTNRVVVRDAAENPVDPIFVLLSFWMEEGIRGRTSAAARLQTDGTKVDRFA